jgi:regulator of replication initiation timing
MNIKSYLFGAIVFAIAFFFAKYAVPLLCAVLIYLTINIFNNIKDLNTKIDSLQKQTEDKNKKMTVDIKTLADNQRLLISLINALRVRVNNFYAKKHKDPKIRFKKFDEGEDNISD